MKKVAKPIVLASSSASRRTLLERLKLPFRQISPDVNESPLANEPVREMTERLAVAKSEKVADQITPDQAIIIGSDQAASLKGYLIGKPGNLDKAVEQLLMLSGQNVLFYTSLCVLDVKSRQKLTSVEQTEVRFRKLSKADIYHYVEVDKPVNAAGSFHAEGLGITLFESIKSEDPSSLVGLPLIRLTSFLSQFGIHLQAMGKQSNAP